MCRQVPSFRGAGDEHDTFAASAGVLEMLEPAPFVEQFRRARRIAGAAVK
jgi:hypothetical protein